MKYIKMLIFIFLTCLAISITACKKMRIENNDGVIINEICTNNGKSLATKDYKYVDWIELYNTTDKDIYLEEYLVNMDMEETYQINASLIPRTADKESLVYESQDENVVTVDENNQFVSFEYKDGYLALEKRKRLL